VSRKEPADLLSLVSFFAFLTSHLVPCFLGKPLCNGRVQVFLRCLIHLDVIISVPISSPYPPSSSHLYIHLSNPKNLWMTERRSRLSSHFMNLITRKYLVSMMPTAYASSKSFDNADANLKVDTMTSAEGASASVSSKNKDGGTVSQTSKSTKSSSEADTTGKDGGSFF
jgi:hypothetical protein